MGIKFDIDWEDTPLIDDREPPEEGWQPHCRVQDHLWAVEFDEDRAAITCVDPCSEDKRATYRPDGTIPGCELESELLGGQTPPFKLKWYDDSTPSGPWGPAEYGGWFYPVKVEEDNA